MILGSRKSSRYQTTLQNSQILLVGLGGKFARYHALTRALNNYLERRAVDPLFELLASFLVLLFDIFSCNSFQTCCRRRGIAYFMRIVSLYTCHTCLYPLRRENQRRRSSQSDRRGRWSVGTSYMVRYGSLVKDMTGYEHARLFPFSNEK